MDDTLRDAYRRAAADLLRSTRPIVKRSTVVPATREMLLDAGAVEPTPAERAEHERHRAEYERLVAEREAKLAAARARLAGIVEEPARTILNLHHEDEGEACQGCEFDGWEAEPPVWPCITTVTIARHYGIDIPEPT
jgi:hypothetical protein